MPNINRFFIPQEKMYKVALNEIINGKKESHWMWYIFPQLKGLGFSEYSIYYGIDNIEEASEYISHPIFGNRLVEITKELLKQKNKDIQDIFTDIDILKLQSCMTLFSFTAKEKDNIFNEVINHFFDGKLDQKTISLLSERK